MGDVHVWTMATKLLVAIWLVFACERVLCEERDGGPVKHSILWDRFWLTDTLINNTLEVKLNDAVLFQCQVNSSEAPEDRIENIILLEEEAHLVQCDIGEEGQSRRLATCSSSIITHIVLITEAQDLVNRPSFAANQSYYFTSFSDGTEESADTDTSRGGACTANPPLKLTIKVLPTAITFANTTSTLFGSSTAMPPPTTDATDKSSIIPANTTTTMIFTPTTDATDKSLIIPANTTTTMIFTPSTTTLIYTSTLTAVAFTAATSILITIIIPSPTTSATNESSGSNDVNIGVIVAPIIIIIVMTLIVIALIIAFYWWKRKKQLSDIDVMLHISPGTEQEPEITVSSERLVKV